MEINNLSVGEQFIVKWQYHALGGFDAALMEAIRKADIVNLSALAKGFPAIVKAYNNYSQTRGWWEKVKKKAKISN